MTITYKKICNEDDWQVRKLIKSVLEQLENKDFFIPISEEELTELYNEKICILYGAYDADKLVAIAKLDLNNKYDVTELKHCLNIEKYQVAELGRYLCLPEYRRNGIMKNLQKILIDEAIKLNYDYLVVTAHPENIASNKTILNEEFELKNTKILSNGFYRNIYLKDIKKYKDYVEKRCE